LSCTSLHEGLSIFEPYLAKNDIFLLFNGHQLRMTPLLPKLVLKLQYKNIEQVQSLITEGENPSFLCTFSIIHIKSLLYLFHLTFLLLSLFFCFPLLLLYVSTYLPYNSLFSVSVFFIHSFDFTRFFILVYSLKKFIF